MLPLSAQFGVIGRQADDLIAGKSNELWRWLQARHNSVDRRQGLFMERARHAGATIGIADKMMAGAIGQEGGNGLWKMVT